MESTGEWDKVDPRDAKLTALTTELNKLKTANRPKPGSEGSGNNQDGHGKIGGVQIWCTIKKGNTLEPDRRTAYWYPHHKHPQGKFDGLYRWHKPEEHFEWKAKFKKTNSNPKPSANPTGNTNSNDKK